MKQEKSDPALHYFDSATTETERATFEAGIALSTLYHSLIGLPVRTDRKQIAALEQAMARLVENQPYKEKVKVRIHQEKLRGGTGEYEYSEISAESLQLEVTARYGGSTVVARMEYADDLNYPLMYLAKIERGAQKCSAGQRKRLAKSD